MKKLIIVFILCFSFNIPQCWAVFDSVAIIAAIERQTAEERGYFIKNLYNMVEQLSSLQQQLTQMQGILEIERWKKEGLEVIDAVSTIPNNWLQGHDFIDGIKSNAQNLESLQGEWKTMFGSTDTVFGKLSVILDSIQDVFKNIEVSDRTNTITYSVGDSFQKKYSDNAKYSKRLGELSREVNEKAALRMIAEELSQLVELQNQTVYILAQMLKSNAVEYSNQALVRKEKVSEFEAECEGVRRFMRVNVGQKGS